MAVSFVGVPETAISVTVALARWAVGCVLIVAGIAKLDKGLRSFREVVFAYALLPRWASVGLGSLLPWFEICLGICIPFGLFAGATSLSAAILFLCFAVAICLNLLRGRRHIACGCFGDRSAPISSRLVGRNLLLAAVSIWPFVAQLLTSPRSTGVSQYSPEPIPVSDGSATLLAIGVIAAALLLRALYLLQRVGRDPLNNLQQAALNRVGRGPETKGRA